jgi:hypothetical protein
LRYFIENRNQFGGCIVGLLELNQVDRLCIERNSRNLIAKISNLSHGLREFSLTTTGVGQLRTDRAGDLPIERGEAQPVDLVRGVCTLSESGDLQGNSVADAGRPGVDGGDVSGGYRGISVAS